jgi:hypothetical protein
MLGSYVLLFYIHFDFCVQYCCIFRIEIFLCQCY